MKKRLLAFSLIALLLLGACASGKQSPAAPMREEFGYSDNYGMVMDYESESPAPDPSAPPSDDNTGQERLVIKNADMRVSVADPEAAMQSVSQLADKMGGFVVSSSVSSGSYKNASISIRVPSNQLDDAMEAIRQLSASGKDGVLYQSVSGQDVTSDYVDSQSRLRNLEAAENQLMVLMENTTDLEQTMAVFRELTATREKIEVIKGHIKYLTESASMSMISVSFVAEASLKPIEIGGWKPKGTARESIQTLINAAQGFADFLIRFGIVWLPFLIPLGLIIFFIVRAINKRKAKRQAEKMANMPYQPAYPHAPQQQVIAEPQQAPAPEQAPDATKED